MAFPQHFLRNHPQHQKQLMSNNPFGNFHNTNDQILPTIAYLSADQPQHPPYTPSFHVAGVAPVPASGAVSTIDEFQLDLGFESQKKRLKEHDFLENNNSKLSPIDFLQGHSMSTGLGLSLDNSRLASSCDSSFLGLIGDEIDMELAKQDAEIDRFLKIQGDRLRQNILEKLQAQQLQTLSFLEQKALKKLREKEAELRKINDKNTELELKLENLDFELSQWQQMAKQNDDTINTLKFNLEQIYARNGGSKEGCGDSGVDDTASCCNGRGESSTLMTCRVCGLNRVCMLLLPCKHVCVCKVCESKVSLCPLCRSSKYMGLEVYM